MTLHTPDEVDKIRDSCRIVSEVQQLLADAIRPGISTIELDCLAEEAIRKNGAHPAFKGYNGFPASICASVNSEAVHGFPNNDSLVAGDMLSIDVGVLLDQYYGDGAFTLGVGQISEANQHLLNTTELALGDGIRSAQPSGRLSDISHAIQLRVESNGMSVIREFGGHGIGRALHEDPHIPNYGSPGKGPKLQVGFVIAIEPIVSMGRPEIVAADDGWTTTTRDGATVAHFEHTVAITKNGPEILTLPKKETTTVL